MNRSRLTLAAVLSVAAFAAQAESPDASAPSARSERTRAEVQADFIANRDRVAAFSREDSGSSYLAAHRATAAAPVLAGQPVNAQ